MPPESNRSLVKICALATGLTMNEVIRIASLGPKRYKIYQIPKRSGGQRTICHPSRELKALQYVFLRNILKDIPVHDAATAYRAGSSIKSNAAAHAESRVILKLDFENFFPSIRVKDWVEYVKEAKPLWTPGDIGFSSYVIFWGAGGYSPEYLSIGAPTSPIVSNALMFQFDSKLAEFATVNNLTYTRYADDITISSKGYLDRDLVLSKVASVIGTMPYPRVKLNAAKTKLVSKATSRRVTGLVIANDGVVSLGRDRKRLISSMVHHALTGRADEDSVSHLVGLLAFAEDVEPSFIKSLSLKYGEESLVALRLRRSS